MPVCLASPWRVLQGPGPSACQSWEPGHRASPRAARGSRRLRGWSVRGRRGLSLCHREARPRAPRPVVGGGAGVGAEAAVMDCVPAARGQAPHTLWASAANTGVACGVCGQQGLACLRLGPRWPASLSSRRAQRDHVPPPALCHPAGSPSPRDRRPTSESALHERLFHFWLQRLQLRDLSLPPGRGSPRGRNTPRGPRPPPLGPSALHTLRPPAPQTPGATGQGPTHPRHSPARVHSCCLPVGLPLTSTTGGMLPPRG